jgi:uncharacterized protein YutE (UPF0331/DUF86 family)
MFEDLLELISLFVFGLSGGIFLMIFSELLKRRTKRRKEFEYLIERLNVDPRAVQEVIDRAQSTEDNDRKAAFLILTIEIERSLRSLAHIPEKLSETLSARRLIASFARESVVDNVWIHSFEDLWKIRNRVVHGLSTTDTEIRWGTRLAASLIVALDRRKQREETP